VSGPVNECTNSSTSEVRIADVINPRSPAIYRELAGGLTISNLLHGSCNAIGGQNAVIKLKWGQPADELLFVQAPLGIKFALGENVKQSNWGGENTTRYPQTRMGVEQFYRDRFFAAEDYRREWNEWERKKKGAPPRRDLQLDALVEILDGERLVHCHSYRSDEIIMLMRVAEDFGFRIQTFQHVLEGYKCADELAAHGAGASSFSDWWSYKYEVVEAIPYSGAIMWERGVNVSYNSDSWEVSRRMNLEGAKAAKWGGVPAEEALNFVVRNPAIQLGIDEWVGTLEPGKHGDFVVWSDDPLSDQAVCLETWIEGVRRFSREEDLAAREAAMELRDKLLAKAGALNRIHELTPGEADKGSWPAWSAFGRKQGESGQAERGGCVDHAGLEGW
jgi:N-acetylglucosamine-6-phosphate deacetylase